MMIEGKTASGFEFSVDERVVTDFTFLELLTAMEDRKDQARQGIAILTVPGRLLGDAGKAALIEHCRDDDGYVPTARMIEEIRNIIRLCSERNRNVKNS